MVARRSEVGKFLLVAMVWCVAIASTVCSVLLIFPLRAEAVSLLSRIHGAVEFFTWAPCFIFVATFGYRPRVMRLFVSRCGFLLSPFTAWLWMVAASILTDAAEARAGALGQTLAAGGAVFLMWLGWLARGPKDAPAFEEKRDQLTEDKMTRLNLT